jgi:heptosyltransferase-2
MNSRANPADPLRLLVLAPNWLGDVVMHTPLLSLLAACRGEIRSTLGRDFHVSLGIRGAWSALFTGDERVDELLILDRKGRYGGLGGAWRLANRLKQELFDAVILCPPSLRTGVAVRLAGIPARVGYKTDGRSLLLTDGLHALPRGEQHYSQEMTALGEAWLARIGLAGVERQFPNALTSLPGCDAIPAAVIPSGIPYWVVAPGTTYGEAKTWPLARVGEFATAAKNTAGVRIVFMGDEAARGFTGQLRQTMSSSWGDNLQDANDFVDLTGRTDLVQAVSVLKSAAAFIGNDSGLMHVAAALGRPTVGVFGSSNPDWTSPVGPATRAVVPAGFECRPCYRKKCNQAQFCLETVSPETVLSTVLELTGSEAHAGEGG